jgi:hypothetical protein
LANVFEAHFQQRFDFFRFLHGFDGEAVVGLLEQGAFNVDVDFRVSQLFVSQEVFNAVWVFRLVVKVSCLSMSKRVEADFPQKSVRVVLTWAVEAAGAESVKEAGSLRAFFCALLEQRRLQQLR